VRETAAADERLRAWQKSPEGWLSGMWPRYRPAAVCGDPRPPPLGRTGQTLVTVGYQLVWSTPKTDRGRRSVALIHPDSPSGLFERSATLSAPLGWAGKSLLQR